MFEELRLLGSTERSIVVQTRKGTPISNVIELEPGAMEQRRYRLLLEQFGPNWIERRPSAGIYNCAGHVWASRRTSILKLEAWHSILSEDGYRIVSQAEMPVAGDLVLYADENGGEYLHVGVILEVREGISPASSPIPWVLSKWNSTSGEVMHFAHDVPYARQGIPTRIQYWTDRPTRT
jgi:hypothetical protein